MKNELEELKQKIQEFDASSALLYCANDEDFLLEMLEDYINSDFLMNIKTYFEEEDWKNYTIKVHALKSTSLMVGFPELSEKAKKLQFAGEGGDIDYIKENNKEVVDDLERYCNIIRGIVAAEE